MPSWLGKDSMIEQEDGDEPGDHRDGPAQAFIATIKDAGYQHIPEGRRDHTTPAETLHLHGLD